MTSPARNWREPAPGALVPEVCLRALDPGAWALVPGACLRALDPEGEAHSDEGQDDRVGSLRETASGRPDRPHPLLRGDLSQFVGKVVGPTDVT
jgi:hypothetical protein